MSEKQEMNAKKTDLQTSSRHNFRYYITFLVIGIPIIAILALIVLSVQIVAKIPFESMNQDFPGMVIFLIEFGLAIIGVAVSVWVGLNVYNLIAKSDLASLEQQISELKDIGAELQNAKRNQSATTRSILLSSLIKTQNDVMSSLFISKISELNLDTLDLSLLSEMFLIEEAFANMVSGYHKRNRVMIENFCAVGLDYCVQFEEKLEQCTTTTKDNRTYYFYRSYMCFRRADFKFYYSIKPSNPPGQNLEELVCHYYKWLSEAISDYGCVENLLCIYLDDIPQTIKSYIANSIGYCYYNKYILLKRFGKQKSEDLENAMKYCCAACYPKNDKDKSFARSIYYRNYGHCVILSKKGVAGLKEALPHFRKSLNVDYRDAKAHYNYASVSLKIIVETEGLGSSREKTLNEVSISREKYLEDVNRAIKNLNWAITFDTHFTDPYFLLAHAYTLQMLMSNSNDEKERFYAKAVEAIETYERLYPPKSTNTYLFYKRNMLEAYGDIVGAKEINDGLEKDGDSGKIGELYDKYLVLSDK